ncbi:MAG TPA: NADH-quinone oxidoreductase subunit C [candidate division Zixibacteria bacterium]|nr:NADH-quinone oxidoreductase subunit C [candidate division Zixibacteria bacterium]
MGFGPIDKLKEKFGAPIGEAVEHRGEWSVYVPKSDLVEVLKFLKTGPGCEFNFLSDITSVDLFMQKPRFEVLYHLFSIPLKHRLRVKVKVEDGEKVYTATPIWEAANWHEREIYDLMGIEFENHPDLRRILMREEWIGHPLRKDFPLTYEMPHFSFNKDLPPEIIK